MIEQHDAFEFTGWSGNRATTDLTVIRRPGFETPIVVATERDDNPGVSITNASEYLGAAVLAKVCPTRLDGSDPFVLIEHHRGQSFDVGNGEFEGLEHTFHQVHFADFRLQRSANGVNRIGEVVAWGPIVADGVRALVEQAVKQPELQPIHSMSKEDVMKASLRPWEVEQVGEYYLGQSQMLPGADGNNYTLDAGTYPIVGKVSNDSRRLLLDTALVYSGRNEWTREEALLPIKMEAHEILQQQAQGKAKVNADFKERVESLAKGVEQGREVTASLGMRR